MRQAEATTRPRSAVVLHSLMSGSESAKTAKRQAWSTENLQPSLCHLHSSALDTSLTCFCFFDHPLVLIVATPTAINSDNTDNVGT